MQLEVAALRKTLGSFQIIGDRFGKPWIVGIRHPRERDGVMATIELARGAVASSGDYERFVEVGGRRYGHIISPATGMPVRSLAAVSVVADECVVAGSATTIAMLMEERGAACAVPFSTQPSTTPLQLGLINLD